MYLNISMIHDLVSGQQQSMAVNKERLIEEVRKRPLLWDYQYSTDPKNLTKRCALWNEIAQILNVDASACRNTWNSLRSQFNNELRRIPIAIAKAKQNGQYDPRRNFHPWRFFDALRFVAAGRGPKAKYSLDFEHDSLAEIAMKNNTASNTFKTESDDDIEIVESYNCDQTHTERQNYFENCYESESDIEFIQNDNLDEAQCQQQKCFENNSLPKESNNTNSIIPVHNLDESNPQDTHFKSYTLSLADCVQDSEYASIYRDNTVLKSDCVIKEEPVLHIKTENDDGNELQVDNSETDSVAEPSVGFKKYNLSVASNVNDHDDQENVKHELSTFPEYKFSSSLGFNDEDYSFLYSFSTQTKTMTELQKMEFRVNMKNLLMRIFPATTSLNILEKQLLLPEDSDPDRKFLISFWPFVKSMSLMQNLQFRAKMADLVLENFIK